LVAFKRVCLKCSPSFSFFLFFFFLPLLFGFVCGGLGWQEDRLFFFFWSPPERKGGRRFVQFGARRGHERECSILALLLFEAIPTAPQTVHIFPPPPLFFSCSPGGFGRFWPDNADISSFPSFPFLFRKGLPPPPPGKTRRGKHSGWEFTREFPFSSSKRGVKIIVDRNPGELKFAPPSPFFFLRNMFTGSAFSPDF